jgi:hypothetical protein
MNGIYNLYLYEKLYIIQKVRKIFKKLKGISSGLQRPFSSAVKLYL